MGDPPIDDNGPPYREPIDDWLTALAGWMLGGAAVTLAVYGIVALVRWLW